MRHTREILRHKWVLLSSHRQTTAALGVSHGSITQTLQRAQAAGIVAWYTVCAITIGGMGGRRH